MERLKKLQDRYYSVRSRLGVIKRDIKSKDNISPKKRLRMWSKGFAGEKYYLYNLKDNNSSDYLSDHMQAMTRFINRPCNEILDDKIIFEKIVSQYIKVPKNYAFIDRGTIRPLQPTGNNRILDSIINDNEIRNEFVIKPIRGAQGEGVQIIKIRDNKIYMNNEKISRQGLERYINNLDRSIITEYIEQGQYAQQLYPNSSNTIRIITMVDPETSKPFIARAVHRIGGHGSGGIDNFTRGGYSADIDLETGVLGPAATKLGMKNLTWHSKHPDTNRKIEGVQVPRWDRVKETLLDLMEKMPYIQYCGWDIIVSDKDIVAIEGNSNPQVGVIQSHRPLLKEQRIRKFYRYYQIL